MPIHHTKDNGVKYSTWYELTDEEKAALVATVEDFEGDVTAVEGEITLSDSVGPGARPGTNLRIPVFSDDKQELPDDLESRLTDAVVDAGVAHSVREVDVGCDPAGEIYHEPVGDDSHPVDNQYKAVITVSGSWKTTESKKHGPRA